MRRNFLFFSFSVPPFAHLPLHELHKLSLFPLAALPFSLFLDSSLFFFFCTKKIFKKFHIFFLFPPHLKKVLKKTKKMDCKELRLVVEFDYIFVFWHVGKFLPNCVERTVFYLFIFVSIFACCERRKCHIRHISQQHFNTISNEWMIFAVSKNKKTKKQNKYR